MQNQMQIKPPVNLVTFGRAFASSHEEWNFLEISLNTLSAVPSATSFLTAQFH